MRNIDKGRLGEAIAEKFLLKKGYKFVERNYRVKGSEIDLIFIEPKKAQVKELDEDIAAGKIKKELRSAIIKSLTNTLVFVEVKLRNGKKYGDAVEAVNTIKQSHMYKGADKFIREYEIENANIRFDIISIQDGDILHIRDAF